MTIIIIPILYNPMRSYVSEFTHRHLQDLSTMCLTTGIDWNEPVIERIQGFGTSFYGRNLITELARCSIRPKNEVPKHCMSSITEVLYMYTSIKLH